MVRRIKKQDKKDFKIVRHIVLLILSIIWLFPIAWIVMISFSGDTGAYHAYFFPKSYTIMNYVRLFTDTSQFYFGKWFLNTLFVAVFSCIISTIFVLSVAYTLSRLRFKFRKSLMNIALILGMFPGFMSMIAVYYILKGIGITESLIALILVYSGGSGLTYYIAKGFFDTVPKAIDEAAYIDGATRFQIFCRITVPLSKSIIIYTILTSFMAPWADFIFARIIMGANYDKYTVAIGLWSMVQTEQIGTWFTRFAAGSVCVSIPIALLFVIMQKYYVEGIAGAVKG